jgi:chromosome segregation ATPase
MRRLMIRDRLNLPPDDPVHELLEANIAKSGEDAEAALREAEKKFEAKRREVRTLRESLDQLQKELVRRERSSLAGSSAPDPATTESDEKLRELRQKVKFLESTLKESHTERNALERLLEEMQAKVEALNQRAQRVPAGNGSDASCWDALPAGIPPPSAVPNG